MKNAKSFLVTALVALAASAVGLAQIERLDLEQMVDRVDNAVYGEIAAKQAYRVEDPNAGELFYTVLTVEGRSLLSGKQTTVDVAYMGGIISEEEGAISSEAPIEAETATGKHVVVFYKWLDDIGGGVSANRLYASHGGLYRTAESPKGTMVLGRGDGYAVSKNLRLEDLERGIDTIRESGDRE